MALMLNQLLLATPLHCLWDNFHEKYVFKRQLAAFDRVIFKAPYGETSLCVTLLKYLNVII